MVPRGMRAMCASLRWHDPNQVQPADVLAVRMDAHTQGDIVPRAQRQVAQRHAGKLLAVQQAVRTVHAPGLEQAELAGRVAPPGRIEPAAPPAVVARAHPGAQRHAVDRDVDVALEVLAVHRRVGGHLHGELDERDLRRVDLAQRKAVFQLAGAEPEHLRAEAVRMVERARGVRLADPRMLGDDAAFGRDVVSGGIAADGQLHGQRAHAVLHLGRQAHAHGIDAPGAQLHGAADARLNLRGDQARFLQLAYVERGGGDRQGKRLRQLVDVHGADAQQRNHPHAHGGGQRLGHGAKALDLTKRERYVSVFIGSDGHGPHLLLPAGGSVTHAPPHNSSRDGLL